MLLKGVCQQQDNCNQVQLDIESRIHQNWKYYRHHRPQECWSRHHLHKLDRKNLIDTKEKSYCKSTQSDMKYMKLHHMMCIQESKATNRAGKILKLKFDWPHKQSHKRMLSDCMSTPFHKQYSLSNHTVNTESRMLMCKAGKFLRTQINLLNKWCRNLLKWSCTRTLFHTGYIESSRIGHNWGRTLKSKVGRLLPKRSLWQCKCFDKTKSLCCK